MTRLSAVNCSLSARGDPGFGEAGRVGSLEPGKQANVLILDASNHLHLRYHFGVNLVQAVFKRGRLVAGQI